jgi:hypothetical protein
MSERVQPARGSWQGLARADAAIQKLVDLLESLDGGGFSLLPLVLSNILQARS